MATYRVVNELGHIEAEFPVYSMAKAEADRCHTRGQRSGHYRVEEVNIVYHTAEKLHSDTFGKLGYDNVRGEVYPVGEKPQ